MNILRTFILIVFLCAAGNTIYGQDNCSYKQIIMKIDSVSRTKHIEIGKVNILFVSNLFDKTYTNTQNLTKESKFHFDGQFLVIEDKYFNINKLLYFYIDDGIIEFFFQGY